MSESEEKRKNYQYSFKYRKNIQLKLSLNEIKNAITNSHIVFSGGFYSKSKSELLVNLDLEKHSINELKNIPIPQRNIGNLLSDIADISVGYLNERKFAKRNGLDAISIEASKIANANTLTIIEKAKVRFLGISFFHLQLEVVSDDSIYF